MRKQLLFIPILLLCFSFVHAQTYVSNRQTTHNVKGSGIKSEETTELKSITINGNNYKAELPSGSILTGQLNFDRVFLKDGKKYKSYKLDNGGAIVISEEQVTLNLYSLQKLVVAYHLKAPLDFSNEEITDTLGNCTFVSNKVDEFTGVRKLTSETMTVALYNDGSEVGTIKFTLTNTEEEYYLLVTNEYKHARQGIPSTKCFNQQSKVLIKKEDNTIITLPAVDKAFCSEFLEDRKTKFIGGAFIINKQQAQQLKSGISKFRIQFTESQIDGEFGGMSKLLGSLGEGLERNDNVPELNSKFFFSRWINCMDNALIK